MRGSQQKEHNVDDDPTQPLEPPCLCLLVRHNRPGRQQTATSGTASTATSGVAAAAPPWLEPSNGWIYVVFWTP